MATSHMHLKGISEDGAQTSLFHDALLEIMIDQSTLSIYIVIIFDSLILYYICYHASIHQLSYVL